MPLASTTEKRPVVAKSIPSVEPSWLKRFHLKVLQRQSFGLPDLHLPLVVLVSLVTKSSWDAVAGGTDFVAAAIKAVGSRETVDEYSMAHQVRCLADALHSWAQSGASGWVLRSLRSLRHSGSMWQCRDCRDCRDASCLAIRVQPSPQSWDLDSQAFRPHLLQTNPSTGALS